MNKIYTRLANLFERLADLSPERQELLELLLIQEQGQLLSGSDLVVELYDSLSVGDSESAFDSHQVDRYEERFLTYAPFSDIVPGFSWILFLADPQKYPEYAQIALKAQKEMRDILFRKVDFSSCKKVLDFGCGYSSDLIALAKKYEHLKLDGYTISSKQAEIGSKKIQSLNLQERIKVFNRDSLKDKFPDSYDLVFGFEVAHHIKDKEGLFSNISKHLNPGGFLVIADFISHVAFQIEDHLTSSFFLTKEEWIEVFSQNHLQVVECVDASPEIANFLYDPNVEENLQKLYQITPDETVKAAFGSFHQGGQLLRRELASYVLLTAQKQSHLSKDELYRLNQTTLNTLLSYSDISLSTWFYKPEWQPQKLQKQQLLPDYIPAPAKISEHLVPHLAQLVAQPELTVHQEALNQLETLSIDYVLKAFHQLGWEFQQNQRFFADAMAEQLGIVIQHRRLLARLLEMLATEGVLRRIGEAWEVVQVPQMQDLPDRWNTLLSLYPSAAAELTLLERCGSKLAEVLRGECNPLQLLFPEGDLSTTSSLYQDSPTFRQMNILVQKTLSAALEQLPEGRKVRILEIGAGTGGTTSYILPHLPVHQIEYVFTDVSALFTTKAREKFREYPCLRYQVFDVEQDPEAQGFALHQFDVVVAANVLHATRDLHQTLQHVQQLLLPGGTLVLLELTAPWRWIDLIFGLTEGWWKFADHHLRPFYPLLCASQWQELLEESGFKASVTISPDRDLGGVNFHQAVIVAQAGAVMPKANPEPGSWLILADAQGTGQNLATLLKAQGEVCTLVYPGKEYEQVAEQAFRINPTCYEHFQQLLQEVVKTNRLPWRGIVHLWSLDIIQAPALTSDDLNGAVQQACGSTLYLLQALIKARFSEVPSMRLVTQGAVPVGAGCHVPGVAQSALWGMGKVIALEHPELNCIRLDLDPKEQKGEALALFEEIWSKTPEDQLAFRNQVRHVARLVRCQPQALADSEQMQFRKDATYVISGGLGGLGLLVARWMVDRGAQHLVLVGRSGASPVASRQLRELEQAGVQVVVAQADVSQAEQVNRLLAEIEFSLPPLRGIIHAAGVLDDGALLLQNWERFERVMAPKIQGAWNLHTLTQNQPLDFFVLFSSTASLLGNPGQSNHAAANAFLDALAYYRRAQGLPGLSINWGAWSDIGAAASHRIEEQFKLKGIGAISPQQGLEALEQLLLQSSIQVGVAPVTWPTFVKQYPPGGEPPFISGLIRQVSGQQPPVKQVDIIHQLEDAAQGDRHSLLISYLQKLAAKSLGLEAFQLLDVQRPLNKMGLDSLMAIEMRNRVKTELGTDVPIVKFMEGLSVVSLATHIGEQLGRTESKPSASLATVVTSNLDAGYSRDAKYEVSTSINPIPENTTENASQILANLDQLTDAEIDVLLKSILSEQEEPS